jgi:hypothetical protein
VIEEKAYRSAKKKIQEDDKFVYMSYDESDIFKPNAEKMQ